MNLFLYSLLLSLKSPLTTSFLPPPSPTPLFLFRNGQAFFHGYQLALACQAAARLGTSSSIEARPDNPIGEKGPRGRQQRQRQTLFPL